MIPTAFDYQRATSLDDAIAKLTAAGGGAKLLAGGHSLVPLMKLRLSEPQLLVDIGRLKDLAGVREKDGAIQIGAATTHHDSRHLGAAGASAARCWPRPPARSATRRCATAARWAAASPTPTRRRTTRP